MQIKVTGIVSLSSSNQPRFGAGISKDIEFDEKWIEIPTERNRKPERYSKLSMILDWYHI